PVLRLPGAVSSRSHSFADSVGPMGLEAIIRKALIGSFEDQSEEASAMSAVAAAGVGVMPGLAGVSPALDGQGQQALGPSPSSSSSSLQVKLPSRPSARKVKSPGPAQSYAERPSSVSSVHSGGDNNRKTPLTHRSWEDRPSSTGSTPFPFNPLMMRLPSSTPPSALTQAPAAVSQVASPAPPPPPPPPPQRTWEREPAPLLSAQYETLSDSDD
uniref:Uncharacterized protein n=1 Tax=Petromyzon marinus TaxID=7757 RepID=S4R6P3_PETMA